MSKVLHASYSGYFPFCVPTGTITFGSFISVSLEEAMSIYWKVRTMSYIFEYDGFYTRIEEGKIQRSQFYNSYAPLQSEEYLVCTNSVPAYWSYDATNTISTPFSTFTDPIEDYPFDPNDQGTIFLWSEMVHYEKTYYIPIDLYINFGDNEPATYTLNYEGSNLNEKSTTITIFQNSVSAIYWGGIEANPFNPIQITINPLEYWSYDGTYDTETGERLDTNIIA